ncbi:MAG: hypothetical protein M3296_00295 [Actinomycetota bacterium]|nr:hypothetical protein [Actinomycetota bacterium]
MTRATVTELPRRLEPLSADTFIERPASLAVTSGPPAAHAAPRASRALLQMPARADRA